jgi:sugar-phosphatase
MNRLKPHLEGIIFDMDGTIIDTEQVWEIAMADLLRRHNINPDAIPIEKAFVFEKMVGIGLPEAMELLKDTFEIAHVTKHDMARSVITQVKDLLKQEVQFIHGFDAFHKKLNREGIPTSIATNCDAESLQSFIQKMNFTDYFGSNIYCVADVDHKPKPDPALFLHAADKIKAKPEQCIVFEDSIWGFKAAAAANMKCIAIKNKKNTAFFADHTHGAIDSYDKAEEEIIRIVTLYLRKQNE